MERRVAERDRRRAGVPGDHVLAGGGRAADDRRQHRPRDAALAADRARDDRPARATTATSSRSADKSLDFTDDGSRARQADRPPPPHDRALPHRRPRHPLGRGPRGGRADRARDVAGARGADAGGDRRRDDLPARPPDRRGRARAGRRCSPTSSSAPRSASCASRTRPRSCCTTSRRPACDPGPRGHSSRAPTRTRSSIASADGRHAVSRSVAETVSVRADPAPAPRAPMPEQLVLSSDRYGR